MSISLGSSIIKRTRFTSGGTRSLRSSFTLSVPTSIPTDTATSVTLFFAHQTSDSETGVQSFVWHAENPASHSVMLDNGPFTKGRSKLVFKVKYNNLAYVAKRCYTLDCGRLVSITANREELVKEGTTLGHAKFFLDNFREECEQQGLSSQVTDFILARKDVLGLTEPFNPSPASGIKKLDYSELSDDDKGELTVPNAVMSSVTWLLEPERGNVQFRKYSGTLEHPWYTDKQGATINAFQHFTYIN